MVRQPCCDKLQVKKGPWTSEEDKRLANFMLANGRCCWRTLPMLAGLRRCGKSCRLRWTNYLRPDLKRGLLTEEEEQLIIDLHAEMGNRWSKIAARMPGRTDNDIKNRWNTYIKKKLVSMGIDPVTHKPLPQEQLANTSDHHSSSTVYQQPASSVSSQVTTCSIESSSSKTFQFWPNIFDDEHAEFPLLNHLWSDETETGTQLVDAGSLGFPCEDEELSDTVWKENKEFPWLMDYAENGFMDSFELRCNKVNNENI